METPPSSSLKPRVPETNTAGDVSHSPIPDHSPSFPFDWSELLDFANEFILPFESNPSPPISPAPEPSPRSPDPDNSGDRIRKRDPRLICPNFLAGVVPCACPEMDEKLAEEEEAALPRKKRTRAAKNRSGLARCQVPGCGSDISELKGYHRAHRVCLQCANAGDVSIDGQSRRYCQQCGKFHILSDFDEGKRSCRRKLERHNDRRREKSIASKGAIKKQARKAISAKDGSLDYDEAEKDITCLSSPIEESETLLELEGQIPTFGSSNSSQNIRSDGGASLIASNTQVDKEKDNPKHNRSQSNFENKSGYSSVCQTGRISFKLFDWNPAEFPRRLRHQIFHWLASMPIELEEYVRPGCTILTSFISMPKFMWVKLLEEPVVYIHGLVAKPGNVLSGTGAFLVHLNNMVFNVDKGGTSVIKIKVKEQVPTLHSVYPRCFEAGKPIELIAYGSNLLQPKFRFLVSFAGKYLANDVFVQSICDEAKGKGIDLLKIYVSHTEPDLFGPAFIEVENDSGLSNFVPILISSKEICSEMKIMEQNFKSNFTEFVLDVAWILKNSLLEFKQLYSTFQIQRFNRLLTYLIQNDPPVNILERAIYRLKILMVKGLFGGVANDDDIGLLKRNVHDARQILYQKRMNVKSLALNSTSGDQVENDSGLSNFVPILIGSKEICSEMKIMEQNFKSNFTKFFVLDVAWILKNSSLEFKHLDSTFQIRRFNRLLTYLIQNDPPVNILGRAIYRLKILMDKGLFVSVANDDDIGLLKRNVHDARQILYQKRMNVKNSALNSTSGNQDMDIKEKGKGDTRINLLSMGEKMKFRRPVLSKTGLYSQPLAFLFVTALCFGACSVIFHHPL